MINSNLVKPKDRSSGVFGDIGTYFFTNETNGRGFIHLHGFLRLCGNIHFETLREEMLKNENSILHLNHNIPILFHS